MSPIIPYSHYYRVGGPPKILVPNLLHAIMPRSHAPEGHVPYRTANHTNLAQGFQGLGVSGFQGLAFRL